MDKQTWVLSFDTGWSTYLFTLPIEMNFAEMVDTAVEQMRYKELVLFNERTEQEERCKIEAASIFDELRKIDQQFEQVIQHFKYHCPAYWTEILISFDLPNCLNQSSREYELILALKELIPAKGRYDTNFKMRIGECVFASDMFYTYYSNQLLSKRYSVYKIEDWANRETHPSHFTGIEYGETLSNCLSPRPIIEPVGYISKANGPLKLKG